jgi:hypothetical protein
MIADNFYTSLKDSLLKVNSVNEEVIGTEFRIEMQPGLVFFDGEFILENNRSIPINLIQVGKLKCSDLTNKIEKFHKATTKNGENKWNRAFIKIHRDGQIKAEFVWDEQLEQDNIDAYKNDRELVRQKWYWEEK